ncbi:hypothetical protein HK101_007305 [Irineochytrium annulatum]|nr:hypothetical protein HK101_007305 [Irineochytrium annulatum]
MSSGDFLLHFMAGAVGGTVGAAVTCPLEVVKTRLQSSLYKAPSAVAAAPSISTSSAAGVLHLRGGNGNGAGAALLRPFRIVGSHVWDVVELLREIKRREGIRALWKGLGPNLIGVVPSRAIYFSVYNHGKKAYTKLNNGRETTTVHMVAAMTAGLATATLTNPIWLVKTRMQLQAENAGANKLQRYKSSFHCLMTIVKTEGVKGLYKGLSASFLGLTESTLQFTMYEYMKKRVIDGKPRGPNPLSKPSLDWKETFAVAATAKLVAAVVTYPHEVLRTRLRQTPAVGSRAKYTGLWQSTKLIYIEEGLAGLYGGLTAHLMRVVPNAAILFATVEFILWVGDGRK